MITYFLFGSMPVSEYFNTGKVKSTEGTVVRYDESEMSALNLLDLYQGWDGHVEITEQEYIKFKKHFN